MNYEIRVTYKNGLSAVVENVEEFVGGYRYFYVRTPEKTLSFERATLHEVARRVHGGDAWLPVLLRKPKVEQ